LKKRKKTGRKVYKISRWGREILIFFSSFFLVSRIRVLEILDRKSEIVNGAVGNL
jgi:hypothetical protein